MATAKKVDSKPKMTIAETRVALEKAQSLLENGHRCYMCDTVKKKDKFHVSTDPYNKTGVCPICKACAEKIALRVDKNGEPHEPTKESVQLALRFENKPFLESVWNSAIQETENLLSGKVRTNVWASYCHIVAMVNYVGMTYFDSDMFKERIIYEDEVTADTLADTHKNQDTYTDYIKNKNDVVRLLSYDPFENEPISDQPFLYSQLLGLLDSSEDANDDMMRTASAISIVRNFLQISKIDDTISKLMSDIQHLQKNSATIKSLQDSKRNLSTMTKDLAAESCISLKNTKNAKKGENTWTGKLKKIKDLNLREYEINGYDIETCKGMQQVSDISINSIIKNLKLDESEYSDMLAEQTKMIHDMNRKTSAYEEAVRILLRENLELRDTLIENGYNLNEDLIDLKELVNVYILSVNEDDKNEQKD